MEITTQAGFSQQAFEAFIASRDEPDWLIEARREAWNAYDQLAWPTRGDEEWSRTDIRMFRLDRYAPLQDPTLQDSTLIPGMPTALLSQGVELGGQITSVDGQATTCRLDSSWAQRGVLFGNLADLVTTHGDLLRPYLLARIVNPSYDKFAALQAAFWTGGHVLYVPRGVVIDQPLHTFDVLSNGGAEITHSLVILDEGAEATFLCETGSAQETDGGLHCGALEVVAGAGAHLRIVNLQNWGLGTWHFAHHKAQLQRDATLQWTVAAMGARLAKVNQHVELAGPGADCQVNGVMFTEAKQHIAYNTLQHHTAPQCRSNFLYKAALQDKSRTVWRGMIKVDPCAQQTDGYQRNDNLLLSPMVRADSIPGLEIEADDVRCTHGSTSGRVDEELIFYAQCRGFTRNEAIRAVVTGFFQQIFDRISIPSVRDALGSAIARRVRDYQ